MTARHRHSRSPTVSSRRHRPFCERRYACRARHPLGHPPWARQTTRTFRVQYAQSPATSSETIVVLWLALKPPKNSRKSASIADRPSGAGRLCGIETADSEWSCMTRVRSAALCASSQGYARSSCRIRGACASRRRRRAGGLAGRQSPRQGGRSGGDSPGIRMRQVHGHVGLPVAHLIARTRDLRQPRMLPENHSKR